MNKIARIRTGGQSGVDRAAMDFARERGIPLCGWCPKNGWAEDYLDPPGLLRDYPELQETPSSGTEQRTRWNMRDADAILTIIPAGSADSKGTEVGLQEGEILGKPMFTASRPEDSPDIIEWLRSLPDEIELCVGGPRASECPEAYEVAMGILRRVENTGEGVVRRILTYTDDVMAVENTFARGGVGPLHHHPHTQITYVVSGVFEFEIDGEKRIVRAGDAMLKTDGVPHGCVCLEDGVLLDIFSPIRKKK